MSAPSRSNKTTGIGTASGTFGGGTIGFGTAPTAGQGGSQQGPSAQSIPTVTPLGRVQNPQFNVFAIHGLMSETTTWTSKGDPPYNWLEDLAQLLPGKRIQVYLVGWNTNALSNANMSQFIGDTCRPLAGTLLGAIGQTPSLANRNANQAFVPSIFIGHSMGGMLARDLLGFMHKESSAPAAGSAQDQLILGTAPTTGGQENVSTKYLPFLEAVAGVILLASPSEGSRLAAPAPLVAAIENLTGGLQANVNAAHLLALMRNSTEQQKITADFNAYCTWYQTTTRRKLIVHALRETAPVAPGLPLVVDPQSADVEASTKLLTTTLTEDLQGLSHLQVTNYTNGEDARLKIILQSFATMMSEGAGQQAPGPAAGPGGAGPGTAMLPGPSTLSRTVAGSSGSAGGAGPST